MIRLWDDFQSSYEVTFLNFKNHLRSAPTNCLWKTAELSPRWFGVAAIDILRGLGIAPWNNHDAYYRTHVASS